MRHAIALLVLLLLAPYSQAVPFLHTVNSVDAGGNKCAPKSYLEQPCPPVCVRDINQCPTQYKPSPCPLGQTYCMDGKCHDNSHNQPSTQFCNALFTSNTTLSSICACTTSGITDFDKYKSWFPCSLITVNVTGIAPKDKVAATTAQCDKVLLLEPSQLSITCPLPVDPSYTFREPIWLSLWSIIGAEVALLMLFITVKRSCESGLNDKHARMVSNKKGTIDFSQKEDPLIPIYCQENFYDLSAMPSVSASLSQLKYTRMDEGIDSSISTTTMVGADEITSYSAVTSSNDNIHFEYYVNSTIGTAVFYSLVAVGLYLQVFLALIVTDYYHALPIALAPNATYFFLTYDLVQKTFVAMWHVMTVYMVVWKLCGYERICAYFRIRVHNVSIAQYVLVAKKVQATQPTDYNETPRLVKKLLRIVHKVERTAERAFNLSTHFTTLPVCRTSHFRFPYFTYEFTRFVFCPLDNTFRPYPYAIASTVASYTMLSNSLSLQGGLHDEEVMRRTELVGHNEISIPRQGFFGIWVNELSGWFYLYQGCCLWVWYYFSYWQMGIVLTVVIIAASIIKSRVQLVSHRYIHKLASVAGHVTVLRNSEWRAGTNSRELVPGDLVLVKPGLLSNDLVLCCGEAVVDESSLTGESRPVRKFAVPGDDTTVLDIVTHKRHVLLAGTTVVQSDKTTYGVVMKTSTGTSRGVLIKKMLHPVPVKFIFDEQLKIVLAAMLAWGVICFCLVIYEMGTGGIGSWFYALFIISEVVSPLLPAVLVAGQSVAADRLVKHHGIFCVDLARITMSGKTQIFAFDKTGTLTKEGLNMWGFLPISHKGENNEKPPQLIYDMKYLSPSTTIGLATCHALHAHEKMLLGNPVDVAMFEATDFTLTDDVVESPTGTAYGVVKRHEFLYSKQTMAVIVQALNSDGSAMDNDNMIIYVKGSFERMRDMAKSVPTWYDDVAKGYAKMGGYVLALGSKVVPKGVSAEEAAAMVRFEVESDIELLGLLVFRNTLKPDTKDAIVELQAGSCRTVMITGDNVYTGIYIARECGLSPSYNGKTTPCVYVELEKNDSNTTNNVSRLIWRDYDTDSVISSAELESRWERRHVEPFELGVSGDAWGAMVNSGDYEKYLLGIRVWARMSPDQKIDVVRRLMTRGVTAMCGDGGNDCGALNAAHVGIALSEAEASMVAPFSSKTKSVRACVDLIREGRTALASSFAGYKFLIMYGLTMSAMCLTMYYFSVVLPQWVWIFIDGIIVVASGYALTQARALPTLLPHRPTAQLLGPQTMISVLAQAAINWIFLFSAIAFLFHQSFFRCNEFDSADIDTSRWWLLGDNFESALISAIVLPQFINNGAVFNFGYKFRLAWYRNYIYTIIYVVFLAVAYTLVLSGPTPFSCWFRMNCGTASVMKSLGYPEPTWFIPEYNSSVGHNIFPQGFRYKIFAMSVCNIILCLFVERVLVLGPLREWIRRRYPLQRKHIPL